MNLAAVQPFSTVIPTLGGFKQMPFNVDYHWLTWEVFI